MRIKIPPARRAMDARIRGGHARGTASTTRYRWLTAGLASATVVVTLLFTSVAARAAFVHAGEFAGPGSLDGELAGPERAAAEASTGNLFVVDSDNDRVQVFAPSDPTAAYLTQFGAGVLDDPFGVAIDQVTGDVYVADAGNRRIAKFNSDGAPVPTYTLDLTFTSPAEGSAAGEIGAFGAALAVDPSSRDLLVADPGDNQVQRYDLTGVFIRAFDGTSSPAGAFSGLQDVAVEGDGDVLVVDAGPDFFTEEPDCCKLDGTTRVERFDGAGAHQASIGNVQGAGRVASDPVSGHTFVADVVPSAPDGGVTSITEFDEADAHVAQHMADANFGSTITGLAIDGTRGRLFEITDVVDYTSPSLSQTGRVSAQVFQDVEPPAVTIDPPADITEESATFKGTIDPQGYATTWRFEYSRDGGANWSQVPESDGEAGNGRGSVAVEARARLAINTAYLVRLVGTNAGGTTVSTELRFATGAVPPLAGTGLTTERTTTTARLEGWVNPRNSETVYWFEYGTTPAYGQVAPAAGGAPVEAGRTAEVFVGETIENLTPGTTYHFRLVARSPAGTAFGEDRTIATRTANAVRGEGVGVNGARGIELVSEPRKNLSGGIGARITSDGGRILYRLLGGSGPASSGITSALLAERKETGWQTLGSVIPPRSQFSLGNIRIEGYNSSLTRFLVRGYRPATGGPHTLVRTSLAGIEHNFGSLPQGYPQSIVSTEDLSRTFGTRTFVPILQDDPTIDGRSLYEFGENGRRIVGRMENDAVPTCGIGQGPPQFATGSTTPREQNWISTDGSHVFFLTSGDDCMAPPNLYVRTNTETKLISRAPIGEPDLADYFIRAAPDGSSVFYASETRLASNDQNDTLDVYRHANDTGNVCITCVVPDADVSRLGSRAPNAVVSSDGSRLYFASTKQLVPGRGRAGEGGLYLIHGRTIRYIATWQIGEEFSYLTSSRPWAMTPDGSVIVLSSRRQLTARNTGDTAQYYRYDARNGSLDCISCVDGVEPETVDLQLGRAGQFSDQDMTKTMSEDGNTIFFLTDTALVASDVNDGRDLYEWHHGQVGLVTDGVTPHLGGPGAATEIADVTPDGSSVVFTAAQRLVPEVEEPGNQVFVARLGARTSRSSVPTPVCIDSCQGAAASPPGQSTAGTVTFFGTPQTDDPEPPVRPARVRIGRGVVVGSVIRLRVRVPSRGRLVVTGTRVRRTARSVSRAGLLSLRIPLSRRARARLRAVRRLSIGLKVRFTPTSGSVSVARLAVSVRGRGGRR